MSYTFGRYGNDDSGYRPFAVLGLNLQPSSHEPKPFIDTEQAQPLTGFKRFLRCRYVKSNPLVFNGYYKVSVFFST